MALERRGGGSYYYRKVRREGRVVSQYLGTGPWASLIAIMDGIGRVQREADRERWKAIRERMDAEEAEAIDLFDRVEAIARSALESAGYHRHKRGEWRRRRRGQD
jgi:hypothetical protein